MPKFKELSERITEYLSNGGLFNPESMDHEKVRDLLIEIRHALELTPTSDDKLKNALQKVRNSSKKLSETIEEWEQKFGEKYE